MTAMLDAEAVYVGGIKRLSILFATLIGVIFFGERQFIRRLVSGIIILGGIAIIQILGMHIFF